MLLEHTVGNLDPLYIVNIVPNGLEIPRLVRLKYAFMLHLSALLSAVLLLSAFGFQLNSFSWLSSPYDEIEEVPIRV